VHNREEGYKNKNWGFNLDLMDSSGNLKAGKYSKIKIGCEIWNVPKMKIALSVLIFICIYYIFIVEFPLANGEWLPWIGGDKLPQLLF
jgi:uncharacterized membrane protein YcfT